MFSEVQPQGTLSRVDKTTSPDGYPGEGRKGHRGRDGLRRARSYLSVSGFHPCRDDIGFAGRWGQRSHSGVVGVEEPFWYSRSFHERTPLDSAFFDFGWSVLVLRLLVSLHVCLFTNTLCDRANTSFCTLYRPALPSADIWAPPS